MFTHKSRRHQWFTSEHILISTEMFPCSSRWKKPALRTLKSFWNCSEDNSTEKKNIRKLRINFPVRLCVTFLKPENEVCRTFLPLLFFFFLFLNVTEISLSSSPLLEKSRPTEVESVTVHQGCSSVMLLSGGKPLQQLNFRGKNWFSETTAAERRSSTLQLHNAGRREDTVNLLHAASS